MAFVFVIVSYHSIIWCPGKALLRDCDIFWVSSLIILDRFHLGQMFLKHVCPNIQHHENIPT